MRALAAMGARQRGAASGRKIRMAARAGGRRRRRGCINHSWPGLVSLTGLAVIWRCQQHRRESAANTRICRKIDKGVWQPVHFRRPSWEKRTGGATAPWETWVRTNHGHSWRER